MIVLSSTSILTWKSECRFVNLQMEKNLAWDCEFTQKNAWQFRRFLGEYRIRAGCPQGTVLSSLGSLMNCLSCPKRCFYVRSQNVSSLSPLMPSRADERRTPAPRRSSVMTLSPAFVVALVFPSPFHFYFTSFFNSLHLTSLQIYCN